MSRRRVNVESMGPGFIPHGHLFGRHAFIVTLCGVEQTPDDTPLYQEIEKRLVGSGLRQCHVVAPPQHAIAAADLAHYLQHVCQHVTVTMAFHAGEYLPADTMVYESVLLVDPGDLFITEDLDRRAGSVSVSYWLGDDRLKLLQQVCDAPYGLYLVLGKEEIGEAKVWLRSNRESEWQLCPRFDFEALEPAEMAAMGG